MNLLADWKEIVKKAWSVRLMVVAGLLSGIEVVLPMFDGAIPRGVFAGASGVVTMAAFVARLLAQKNLGDES